MPHHRRQAACPAVAVLFGVTGDLKQILGERLTTVFPRLGHYAFDPRNLATYSPADITLERIGDLARVELPDLLGQRTTHLSSKETP